MDTYTDPNQVRLTGENQFMRLHTEAQGPMTTRASHWRILLSPSGPGHMLFLRSDVTDNERRIYTDNIAMTRWLQEEILAAGEFSDSTIPVMHAVFSRSGNSQSFWTETIDTLTEHLALTWYDFGEPFIISVPPGSVPERPLGWSSVFVPARRAQLTLNGRVATGQPFPEQRGERMSSTAGLARLSDRQFFPSPAAWEDQVLYFLMLDRFSDGNEQGYRGNNGRRVRRGTTPQFQPTDAESAFRTPEEADHWREAGAHWVGGTLKGLTSKIGYLQRLGVTALWVSPIFKQAAFHDTYHGYGIHNFLEVDPHFGRRADLVQMVETAHRAGIYVILDIILNHTGDVFGYNPDRYRTADGGMDPRWDWRPYAVRGFHDAHGRPSLPFELVNLEQHPSAWPDGAIWPIEFQEPTVFTQQGHITNWDYEPEFLNGDFFDLKDLHLGQGTIDTYQPSPTLLALCQVYTFLMALADDYGFRVDTVKHMDPGAARFFTAVIHEFAASLGKENFYLIGEITGGRQRAFNTLEQTGLDAALGIDDIPDKLEYLVKGYRNPSEYFGLFRNSLLVQKESHVWFKNKIVTLFDDHDQVRKGT